MQRSNSPAALTPDLRARLAREQFFDHGIDTAGMIDDAIRESWQRCSEQRRSVGDRIHFDVHDRAAVHELQQQHSLLIGDFMAALHPLASVLRESGFYPILTDAQCVTIACFNTPDGLTGAYRDALEPGAEMSEQAIGTAAMNCAIAVQRPVQVFGQEHYFRANFPFYCAAAPVFSPSGDLMGSVNLTKHRDGQDFGALSLSDYCAGYIEQRQLARLKGFLTLRLAWTANDTAGSTLLVLGPGGQLLGMTREARRLLNPFSLPTQALSFEQIFHLPFASCIDALRREDTVPLRLASGLLLYARATGGGANGTPTVRLPATVIQATKVQPRPGPDMGDPAFEQEFNVALKALTRAMPVLLQGETGTGKEVVARALHERSPSSNGRFVAINCAAIPETLIESELFGYVDGAFSGGRKGGASGRIEEAHGGTLFLDEIGDMPLALQARLLRVLETREVSRLGSGDTRLVQFQLIAATHRDLNGPSASVTFRQDLYYRVAGYILPLAPLRERSGREDFFAYLASHVCGHPAGLDTKALAPLMAYDWPGNTREALNVLRRAILMCNPDEALGLHDVQRAMRGLTTTVVADTVPREADLERLIHLEVRGISKALRAAGGNVTRAAQSLGISRSTLQRRIRAFPALRSEVTGEPD